MNEHRPEVADVFRQYEQEFLDRWRSVLSYRQLETLRDIGACRTAALGAHLYVCSDCQREVLVYNSCLNRHCPKCGGKARDRWLDKYSQELLPVAYSHVIFTLPHELIPLVLQNPKLLYGIFFRAVSQALLTIAADPRHLGARLGFLAVLHTWNQRLEAHPHIHCLVPAGGMALDQTRWIACRNLKFFLPVKVLAAKCRGKFRNRVCFNRRKHRRHEMRQPFGVNDRVGNLIRLARNEPAPDRIALGPEIFTLVVEALGLFVDDDAEWNAVKTRDDAAVKFWCPSIERDRVAAAWITNRLCSVFEQLL